MTEQAYPLSWPHGWPRTPRNNIGAANFGKRQGNNWENAYRPKVKLTVFDAVEKLLKGLS